MILGQNKLDQTLYRKSNYDFVRETRDWNCWNYFKLRYISMSSVNTFGLSSDSQLFSEG